jgi:phosphoenolpyruvate carboxykinase (GTP)
MADYFTHWLSFAQRTDRAKLPKVYFVNWFRKDGNGRWLWPGYGENSRVLKWICERVEGTAKAQKTPIGNLPTSDALDVSGLNLPANDVQQLLAVDVAGWKKEVQDVAVDYARFDGKLPKALHDQLDSLRKRLA